MVVLSQHLLLLLERLVSDFPLLASECERERLLDERFLGVLPQFRRFKEVPRIRTLELTLIDLEPVVVSLHIERY